MGELRISRRRRLQGFEYVGRNTYHVATVTAMRRRVLVDDFASAVFDEIRTAALRTGFALLSFVVMPDHVHALVSGMHDDSNLIRFVQRFKQITGFAYKQRTGEQLWQWSFYDRIIRKTEDVAGIARYIAENPDRAGLIGDGERWPYAGGELVEATPAVDRASSGAEAPPLLERHRASSGVEAPPLLGAQ